MATLRGKRIIGLVINERQARTLLVYLRALDEHGAGRVAAKNLRAIRVKLSKSVQRLDGDRKPR